MHTSTTYGAGAARKRAKVDRPSRMIRRVYLLLFGFAVGVVFTATVGLFILEALSHG